MIKINFSESSEIRLIGDGEEIECVLDPFSNNPIVHESRFEVNNISEINIIPFSSSDDHFTSLPNLRIEMDSENEDE
ncbi:hypothetical protein KQX54_011594 [Cotesia glomerata]|uniref:Uncharacterized protein n=1 Tax=Cotesia glomerata TaxID=32391 RepID=A0AAV7I4A6_COTGL|nr:hypothetical protein KQX54_011594 [Cotesia glomerata]